jgi:phosphate uptake regulator
MVEIRKVQQVGYSTLVVSLPKEWAKEFGLKQGDVVSFVREDDGSLRLYPGIAEGEKSVIKCAVDADQCKEKGMLARVITGSYILGHDTIEIVSKRELTAEQLEEIISTIQKLNGIGIVEQSLRHVTVQCFVDPTKFPFDKLIRRLYVITSSMQAMALKALKESSVDLAKKAIKMEEEVDRIYWLAVRQLVVAARDREMAKKIGIERPERIAGNRVVLKALEKIGDLAEAMAKEVLTVVENGYKADADLERKITEFGDVVQNIFDNAMKALFLSDIKLANKVMWMVELAIQQEKALLEEMTLKDLDAVCAGEGLGPCAIIILLSVRGIAWSLGHIARFCGTIAEIAINRTLEGSTALVKCERA